MYRNFKEIILNKFFAGVNESVIDAHFKPECFKDVIEGDILYQTGDSADSLYLLLRGEVKIKFPSHNYISSKIFNEFFGEKELIDGGRRISSAIANSNCLLYLIDEDTFNTLLSKSEIIRSNLDYYGDVKIPEIKPGSNSDIKFTDSSNPISFEETNSPEDQSNNIKEELESNTESVSDSMAEIIEEDYYELELKTEDDLENLIEESSEENISQSGNSEEKTDIKVEEQVKEEKEQSPQKPQTRQIDVQKILETLIALHSRLTVYDTIQSAINETKDLTKSEAGEIYLVEEIPGSIARYSSDNGKIKKHMFNNISKSLTGTCLQQKKIINFDNSSEDNRFITKIDQPGDDNLNYIIYIPLLNTNEDVVAVLQLARTSKKYTEDEIETIELISDHAGLAIERSKRIQQMIELEDHDASLNISKFLSENISTPVDVINRYTLMLNSEELSEKVKEIISMLQKQANFFPDIIRTAFDYNKSDFKLKLKSLSLNSYMNSISELLSEYCDSRNINLFKKLGEDVKLKIDPGKFFMALYQAIKNGCDSMDINGNLYISTEKADLFANIIIRDEGAGIPDEDKDEIFRSVLSKRKGRNTLGLPITKRIIELHQGKISFLSKLNEGTTFTFSIPIAKDAELMPQLKDLPSDDVDDFNLDLDEDTNLDLKTE